MFPTVAACGVPTDTTARAFDDDRIPEELRAPGTTVPDQIGSGEPATVFFLRGDELTARGREVDDNGSIMAVVGALVAGPRADDAAEDDIESAISQRLAILSSSGPDDGLATLNFNAELVEAADGPTEIQAFAQIVWTATNVPGVDRVRFLVDGGPTPAPVAGGAALDRPVTRADYPSADPTDVAATLESGGP